MLYSCYTFDILFLFSFQVPDKDTATHRARGNNVRVLQHAINRQGQLGRLGNPHEGTNSKDNIIPYLIPIEYMNALILDIHINNGMSINIHIDININIDIHIIINMNRKYWYPQAPLTASSRTFVLVVMPF